MNRVTIGLGVLLALCMVLAIGGAGMAGTVGKVTGKVVDAKGEPLPGVNVVLEGMRKGATTDKDGIYVILSVDPGVYSAKASVIGFHSVTKREVAVRADFTTTVDFRLQEKAVEMAEVVVQAERPPVEPDKTDSRYVLTAKDIAQTPILRTVTDFVTLEAGVAKDGTQAVRGSYNTHNMVYVDGVPVQGRDGRGIGGGFATGGETQWSGVNVKAVQEISLITGGMNAEYGNASGGVVQVVTRDGGSKYHGGVEYRLTPAGQKHWGANVYEAPELRGNAMWNDPTWVSEVDPVTGRLAHPRLNYTDWRGHYFDGYLSGPLLPSVSFFASAVYRRDAAVVPGPWRTRPPNIRTTTKLTASAGPNVKLRFGWIFDRSEDVNNGRMSRSSFPNILMAPGRDLFMPEGSPAGKETQLDNMVYGVLTHTLSPKTFYEVRLSHYRSKLDTSDVGTRTTAVRADKGGFFYIGRDDVWAYKTGEQRRISLKADLSSQVTKGHFAKAGVEFTKFSNWWIWTGMTPGDAKRDIRYIGQPGPTDPVTPQQIGVYVQDKMEFEGLVVNAGIRYDRLWGQDVQILPAFTAGWYNFMDRYLQAPTAPMRPVGGWSPRLGLSHPITSRSSLHFFYGKFLMIPSFRQMFGHHFETASGPAGIPGVAWSQFNAKDESPGVNAISPSWDRGHPTTSFEVGADWNFVSDYTVALAAFYKSSNLQTTGLWNDTVDPVTGRTNAIGGTYGSERIEDIKGFEFSMRKEFSHYFSFRAAFNLEWLDSDSYAGNIKDLASILVYPDSSFIASGKYHKAWQVVGNREQPVKLTDAEIREIGARANANLARVRSNPLVFNPGGAAPEVLPAWEAPGAPDEAREYLRGLWYQKISVGNGSPFTRGRESQGSLQVYLSTPMDFGPGRKVAGGMLLGGINANLVYRIYSGDKFRYNTLAGKTINARGPLHSQVDLNVQKRLRFGGLDADLFVEVFNLFNQKDAIASGNDSMWWGLQKPRPDDANYLQYGDFSDRTRYRDNPRISHVGVRFTF